MRVIAFSDSHGRQGAVARLLSMTCKTTQLYLFAGDGLGDVEAVLKDYPDIRLLSVKGNCDLGSRAAEVAGCKVENTSIIVTHGHNRGVKYGTDGLERLAYENKAQLVVYGHTHCRACEYKNGVYYVNPGSLSLPRDGLGASYAAIDIIPAGVLVTLADFDNHYSI